MSTTFDTTAARVAMLRGRAHEAHPHHDHLVHVTVHATGRRHVLHDVLDFLMLGLVLLVVWFLWPVNFGGTARFIMVQGKSMEPTFHLGDAVIVKTLDDPQVGDIVVFRIPKGEPGEGGFVVHRLYEIRPDGTFVTKGDNRRVPDPFHVTAADIMGTPAWTLPQVGRGIMALSNPFVLGGAIGLIAFIVIMPHGKKDDDEADTDEADTAAVMPARPRSRPRRARGRARVTQAEPLGPGSVFVPMTARHHSVDHPTLELPITESIPGFHPVMSYNSVDR